MLHHSIVCLMGPTASGKTALAVELVKRFPFEIISVDSAMIYRGMDIGTAKPDKEILAVAPHRLIDICDPADHYSVGEFRRDALIAIEAIFAQGKIPLLVGGTMLYFRALQMGLSDLPRSNQAARSALLEESEQIGWPKLHERLITIDPLAASRIHPNDGQRIQRALEVYQATGKTLTEWQKQQPVMSTSYPILNIILSPGDRSVLHERIEKRFDEMLAKGFLDEVKQFFDRGDLSLSNPSMRSVGYRQAWEYFLVQYDKENMRNRAIFATRQFAKRQLTWLRSWEGAQWLDSEDNRVLDKLIKLLNLDAS